MARQVIVLEQLGEQVAGAPLRFRFAFWPVVPTARRQFYVDATATSQVIGASVAEQTALRNGEFVEVIEDAQWPAGTGVAKIRSDLESRFAEVQAQINRDNRWARYGTSWDGASWTNVTTA